MGQPLSATQTLRTADAELALVIADFCFAARKKQVPLPIFVRKAAALPVRRAKVAVEILNWLLRIDRIPHA